jgi:hypothetical protein
LQTDAKNDDDLQQADDLNLIIGDEKEDAAEEVNKAPENEDQPAPVNTGNAEVEDGTNLD